MPISFNMSSILQEKYYNIGNSTKYLVQTWSQAKSSGIKLQEVLGFSKSFDPKIQPEKQVAKPLFKETSLVKPRIGQERAQSRWKKHLINQLIVQSVENSQKIPQLPKLHMEVINKPNFTTPVQSIRNPSTEAINRKMMQKRSKGIPFYPDPVYWPPPKPLKIPMSEFPGKMDINSELNTNFEENSPFQEGVISETYQKPDKSFFFHISQQFESLINTGRLVQKFLPKQADIEKY